MINQNLAKLFVKLTIQKYWYTKKPLMILLAVHSTGCLKAENHQKDFKASGFSRNHVHSWNLRYYKKEKCRCCLRWIWWHLWNYDGRDIEELFGEIEDEHDSTDLLEEVVEKMFIGFPSMMNYINETWLELPESDEYETLEV